MHTLKYTIVAVVILTSACIFERRTEVKIDGDQQPMFTLTGSGDLVEVYVYEPGFEGQLSDESHAIWKIKAERMAGRPVEEVGKVKYGVVPQGFKQIVPREGESPPQLQKGVQYEFNFVTGNAPGVKGYFEIQDSKSVLVGTWH